MKSIILNILGILLIVIGLFATSFTLVTYRRYETEAQHWESEAIIYHDVMLESQRSNTNDGGTTATSYSNAMQNATIADAKANQCIWGFAGAIFIMASGLTILIFIRKYEKEKMILQ